MRDRAQTPEFVWHQLGNTDQLLADGGDPVRVHVPRMPGHDQAANLSVVPCGDVGCDRGKADEMLVAREDVATFRCVLQVLLEPLAVGNRLRGKRFVGRPS